MTQGRLLHLERQLKVLAENLAVFAEWKRIATAHGVSGRAVHDARLVAQMTIFGVPAILTLNPADFRRYPGISVFTPAEFLAEQSTP